MYTAPSAPLSIGGVIDNAIEIFKASFRHCWVAALVYAILVMVISVYMQSGFARPLVSTATPDLRALLAMYESPGFWGGYLLILALSMAFNLMIIATIVEVARGRDGGNAMSRFGTVLPWLPGAIVALIVMIIACAIGFIFLVIPGVYLVVRWMLWTVALADERRGGFAALGTSWRLVGGHWWRTMVVLTVVGIVTIIVAMVFGFVAGFFGAMFAADFTSRLMVTQALNGLAQILYLPAITATMVAIYMDLKLRKDGTDLEARLGALEASPSRA